LKFDGIMTPRLSECDCNEASISYLHYRSESAGGDDGDGCRRLLLLHGAGVAGDLTWRFVVNFLKGWDEVVVPDLPGMGGSRFHPDADASLKSYLSSINSLVADLGWSEYSLVGYSFGGLLAMHHSENNPAIKSLALIEPAALLSGDCKDLEQRGRDYSLLSADIRQSDNPAGAVIAFLDLVSPRRDKTSASESVAVKRLLERADALADGVAMVGKALTDNAVWYANWLPSVGGVSLIGGLSSRTMHARHEALQSPGWKFCEIEGADHGLVYTRPRQIARILNDSL